jgi:hypothetical protein
MHAAIPSVAKLDESWINRAFVDFWRVVARKTSHLRIAGTPVKGTEIFVG